VRARIALARIIWEQGDLASARAEIEIAADEARQLRDLSVEAYAASIHGAIEGTAGNLEAAEARFRSAMELFDEIGDERGAAWMTHNLGVVALKLGETLRARTLFDDALGHARALSNAWLEASSLGNLGLIALEEGRAADARDLARAALRTYADSGLFVLSTAMDLYTLAAAIAAGGDASDACVLLGAADAYIAEVGAVPDPLWEKVRTDTRQIAAAHLGEERARAVEHSGADIPLNDAVALALK
jgi:tetratricopeptide (TPR) repeat protein